MNRHERRRAKAIGRENKFFNDYVSHLPTVPLDAPLQQGPVYHQVLFHDAWCRIYSGGACNCDPIVELRVEPKRS